MSIRIIQAGETPEPVPQAVAAAPVAAQTVPAAAPPAAPTPSESILRAAPGRKTAVITVPSGRSFTVRRLGALDRMNAARAIGSELVTNALWANYALVACSITAIDGQVHGMPSSQMQIEAIVHRVGDDFEDLTELMREALSEPEAAPFDGAAVKN
ncbi:hypothetical protein [Methylobacterium sp. J-090]|uniref:hypothetical protein n=1 Tax=Methylobacterium sp. J-090 TaxID=2836666 RepID=UPI001FB8A607|nr:hypothetical protein [Methylobacterium sp. J-090]MCJ2080171.1 hypothetical protein [Methylobacterium sp. J-090]